MKIMGIGGMFLNLFVATLAGKSFAEAQPMHRYIIVHPNSTDPFDYMDGGIASNVKPIFEHNDNGWFSALLTESQAQNISTKLQGIGSVSIDDEIYLPSQDTNTNDRRRLRGSAGTADVPFYLTDYPQCNAEVNNVDIFVLDTVIYTDDDAFTGVNIRNLKSYADDTPNNPIACNPHGSEVASIITGKSIGVIRSGNRRVYGIGVFDCNGRGFVASIISGFRDVVAHENTLKANAKNGGALRRSIINLSGSAKSNEALNAAARAVIDAGIPLMTAAGNSANNACVNQSPAQAQGVFAVGATIGGNEPASFTAFGDCVSVYLPGNGVTATNVNGPGTVPVSGTSFSTPIATAEGAMELSANLMATKDQIYQSILDRTVVINLPANSFIGNTMRVMPADLACVKPITFTPTTKQPTAKPTTKQPTAKPTTAFPTKKPVTVPTTLAPTPTIIPTLSPTPVSLFADYVTKAADNNVFRNWMNINTDPNTPFCMQFSMIALTKNGKALIGVKGDTVTTRIAIGKPIGSGKYQNALRENNVPKASRNTATRLINIKKSVDYRLEQKDNTFLVGYYKDSQYTQLFKLTEDHDYQKIALSAGDGGRVSYTNIAPC